MITSTSNAQIKNLILLGKKNKARKEQEVFLIEGPKMFEEAPEEWIRKIFVSETFLQEEQNCRIIEGREYEVLSDHVMKAASDTQTPQGILSILQQPKWEYKDMTDVKAPAILFLEGIQDPGNLGTMVRSAEAAGMSGIIVNSSTVDIYNPKTIRSTMGSIYRVPVCVAQDFYSVVQMMKDNGMRIYAAHLNGSVSYDTPNYCGSTGFLIGNESNGLSEEAAALSNMCVRIPMEGRVESLNAAMAATIFMYEINRQRRG